MSRRGQIISGGRPGVPSDRRPRAELSDRERDFWRHAVALERERLEREACAAHEPATTALR